MVLVFVPLTSQSLNPRGLNNLTTFLEWFPWLLNTALLQLHCLKLENREQNV